MARAASTAKHLSTDDCRKPAPTPSLYIHRPFLLPKTYLAHCLPYYGRAPRSGITEVRNPEGKINESKRTILTALAISASVGFSLQPGWSQSSGSGSSGSKSGSAGETRKAPSETETG